MPYLVSFVVKHEKPVSGSNQQSKQRRRLQKAPKGVARSSCEGVLDAGLYLVRTERRAGYDDGADAELTGIKPSFDQPDTSICTGARRHSLPPSSASLTSRSLNSISIYSKETMDFELLKRTRAKTPCFWIGQLDRKPRLDDDSVLDEESGDTKDAAEMLSNSYQAQLPPRAYTPFDEQEFPRPWKTVRKIKGQQSLRELVTCDRPSTGNSSDTETLVGTATPKSQASPTSSCFPSHLSHDSKDSIQDKAKENHNIGFRICLDMLTNELANGLFKQHPVEDLDRASGLQIMLMIEAYESVQQHMRQEIQELRNTGQACDQFSTVEDMLDNWLEALYALYEQSDAKKSQIFSRPMSYFHDGLSKTMKPDSFDPESPDEYYDCEDLGQRHPIRMTRT